MLKKFICKIAQGISVILILSFLSFFLLSLMPGDPFSDMIMANPEYDETNKIGMVVDSDLGNIPDFNSREKPIINDFYLPFGFELIYVLIRNDSSPYHEDVEERHERREEGGGQLHQGGQCEYR